MDASTPQTPDLQRQQDRKRKRKALLAGGVVLGLGAAVTLAAWSDDVFADGQFNTGGFSLVGAVDVAGTVFQDYDGPGGSADSAPLTFALSSTEMAPGETVYAPLTIAASDDSKHAGTFKLNMIQSTGKYSGIINYSIYSGLSAHGENCSPTGASALGSPWASGFTPLDPAIDLEDGFQVSRFPVLLQPVLSILNTLIGGTTTVVDVLLGALGVSVADLTPDADEIGLPYVGTGNAALPVNSASDQVQHLCIAAKLGGTPSSGPLAAQASLVPELMVRMADIAAESDNSNTQVTWIFSGEAVN